MLGAIIGDIVGSRFEFNNHKTKDFELFTDECYLTDDSLMSLAIATAIVKTNKLSHYGDWSREGYYSILKASTIMWMKDLGGRYPDSGFGGMFSKWLESEKPLPYGSYGNGAAMRVSPVAYEALTEAHLFKLTSTVTAISHSHPEGLKGAIATALTIYLAKEGFSKKMIRKRIEKDFYSLDFTLESIRDDYTFDVTCQGTVPQAIVAFLESDSFEDAIRNAVSIGGDSDTIAAITGSMAEAFYGIPEDLEKKALSYLDEYQLTLYENCKHLKQLKLTPIMPDDWF